MPQGKYKLVVPKNMPSFSRYAGINKKKSQFSKKQARKLRLLAKSKEFNHFDTDATANPTTSGDLLIPSMVLMQEGDESDNREGDKVTVTSIYVKGVLTLGYDSNKAISVLKNTAIVKLLIVLDKARSKGATQITYSDIFTGLDLNDFRNLETTSRFQILKEKIVHLHSNAVSYQSGLNAYSSFDVAKYVTMSIPKVNIPIEYSASTGAVGDLTKNNLLLIGITEGGGIVGGSLKSRVRYLD